MRARRKALIFALTILLLAATTSGCGADSTPPERIVIAGGVDGGVYARYAAALSQALTAALGHRVQVSVLSTAGSVDNLRRLAAGEATFAICAADAVADARLGDIGLNNTATWRTCAAAGSPSAAPPPAPRSSSAGSWPPSGSPGSPPSPSSACPRPSTPSTADR
ncbi:MAG: hypothetical protein AUG49_09940 [Catenulispora sp. 13_1_20CM_3_70_7]|nr:MAG: hypothetical protein AUG49_09940 [Catenulispora sp. 13_1_20CM_3_70_7]